VIVVWRLDRLGRSLKDLIETVQALEQRGFELKSLKENIDTTTPTGKLMFHMMAALAEFEHDVIRERTLAGLDTTRTRGRTGGRRKASETLRPEQNNSTLLGSIALPRLWPSPASRSERHSIRMSSCREARVKQAVVSSSLPYTTKQRCEPNNSSNSAPFNFWNYIIPPPLLKYSIMYYKQ
jgi:hypothetical protein